jgi:hypothetical protein
MHALKRRGTSAVLVGALATAVAPEAHATGDDIVRECIDASTRGQTLRQQGHLLGAREQMIQCARDACPSVVRSHCMRWLGDIDERIPSIIVRAQDAGGVDLVDARVVIDGRPGKLDGRAVQLDPGEHIVAVVRDGARREERLILVEGEASRLVMLRLPPAAPAPRAVQPEVQPAYERRIPLATWVLGGVGVAALGTATYFGVAAKAQLDDLNASCTPHCTDAQTRPGRADALAFDVLLAAGGAAVGAAVVWALAFPTSIELRPTARGATAAWTLRY